MMLNSFIQSLPKTETHLHIEGAVPYMLLTEWKPETYPPHPYFQSPDYRYPGFPEFEEILARHALPWFSNPERYHSASKYIFKTLQEQNVSYVECSFHLPAAIRLGIPMEEIIQAIRSAAPRDMELRVFAGMRRNDYVGKMKLLIDDLGNYPLLSGVDLHGDETLPLESWTAPVWEQLRRVGKITKAHAGEFRGAESVREVIESLGVTRVQHGTRAFENPSVMALAAERGVTFDMCPVSNVKLRVVPDISLHPIRHFMTAGIPCTVSTDDPLAFNNTLSDEYLTLAAQADFSVSELSQIACNGWQIADISEEKRQAAIRQIRDLESEFEHAHSWQSDSFDS